jgi:hypothetical protein
VLYDLKVRAHQGQKGAKDKECSRHSKQENVDGNSAVIESSLLEILREESS